MKTTEIREGLEGVVAARTALSSVDGEAGELIIGGYPVDVLAPNASFEEVMYLLWNGRVPTESELTLLRAELSAAYALPGAVVELLRAAASNRCAPMDALRMAVASLDIDRNAIDGNDSAPTNGSGSHGSDRMMGGATTITARVPTIVATYWRLLNGLQPIVPDPTLSLAGNLLYMLEGSAPSTSRVRALETYLITVSDHGLNASTFAARVVISTGSDLVSAITAAVGALKGPLHGGAPGPALDMVFEIGTLDRAESFLREKIGRGERLMGFGHRVYKVRDPRADVLGEAARSLFARDGDGDAALYALATGVERIALSLLNELKPGRRLQTNVEFYTALLLHGLNIPNALFTPTFAVGRVIGWLAHAREQQLDGRLIRPSSVYTGTVSQQWLPISDR